MAEVIAQFVNLQGKAQVLVVMNSNMLMFDEKTEGRKFFVADQNNSLICKFVFSIADFLSSCSGETLKRSAFCLNTDRIDTFSRPNSLLYYKTLILYASSK